MPACWSAEVIFKPNGWKESSQKRDEQKVILSFVLRQTEKKKKCICLVFWQGYYDSYFYVNLGHEVPRYLVKHSGCFPEGEVNT